MSLLGLDPDQPSASLMKVRMNFMKGRIKLQTEASADLRENRILLYLRKEFNQ